jgi:hypothetical protein
MFIYYRCQETAHDILQRRFAYENPELLDRGEDDEEQTPATSPSPDESIDDPMSSASSAASEPARKKRKRGGRTMRGQDFWSQVEKWFEARQKQWGDSWGTPGWKS